MVVDRPSPLCCLDRTLLSWYSRYHCLSSGRPEGVITVGRSAGDGLHDVSFNKLILCSAPFPLFFTKTHPDLSVVKRKCEMPLRTALMILSLSKKPLQS